MKRKIELFFTNQYNFSRDFARMIVAVSAFETGYWTSRIYKRNRNLFGMKHPSIRKTTSLGEMNDHAYYQNKDNSLKDFVFYLRYFGYSGEYGIDLYRFVLEMQLKGYFEIDFFDYYKGVSACYEKLFGVESTKPIIT